MRKRILTIATIICILAVVFIVIMVSRRGKDTTNNPSRRDRGGEINTASDEDLTALIGDDVPGDSANESTDKDADKNQLGTTTVSGDVNSPESDNVEVVRKVVMPEVVQMGDGDIGAFYSDEEFRDVIPIDIESFSNADVPSEYDSRDVDGRSYITEVKNQGSIPFCWAYAAIGALESDILKHNDNVSLDELDLSEKHLAYYCFHQTEGSKEGLIDDDYRELINGDGVSDDWVLDNDTSYIGCGGVVDYCMSVFTAWKGPVEDKDDDSFTSMFGNTYIYTDNTSKPSPAYGGDIHVQSVNQIPCTLENNLLIKQMIMEHGSATIDINSNDKFWRDHGRNLYSHYDGKVEPADHIVLIVGWDDKYSASNFSREPEGDGAWLCRNSWGKENGDEGYFYLSYYDQTIHINNAVSYGAVLRGDSGFYDNNYQAAGFLVNVNSCLVDSENKMSAYSQSSNPYGMLYTASSDEILKAVGILSLDLYQQYELSVYINPVEDGDNVKIQDEDSAVVSQKISSISGGFHTYELSEEIELKEGDRFFVLINPVSKGRLAFEEAVDTVGDSNYDYDLYVGNFHNNYSASGLSYYISDDGKSMVRQDDKDFFVKAYTVNE